MKEFSLNVVYTELDLVSELEEAERKLLEAATESCDKAYAPYSSFKVGAAVLLENGKIVYGNNQENAAYPSGLCAERVAMFSASAQYPGIPIIAIAITAKSGVFHVNFPVSPCGACRQVMAEYENHGNKPIKVILKGESGKIIIVKNISTLLPLAFNASHLKPDQK